MLYIIFQYILELILIQRIWIGFTTAILERLLCLGSGLAGSSLVKMKTPELISSTQPEEEMSTPKGKPSSFTKLEKGKKQHLYLIIYKNL